MWFLDRFHLDGKRVNQKLGRNSERRLPGLCVSATMVLIVGGQLRFYTKEECEAWLSDKQRQKPDLMSDMQVERIEYPSAPYQVFFFAHWVASELTHRRPTLLF